MSKNFMSLTEIPVKLTYGFVEPKTTIVFPCRMLLSDEDKEFRSAFFNKPEADRDAARHSFNVEMLGRLMIAPPENLPGFDELYFEIAPKETGHENTPDVKVAKAGANLAECLREYFSQETPMNFKVANDAVNAYYRIAEPEEFFR